MPTVNGGSGMRPTLDASGGGHGCRVGLGRERQPRVSVETGLRQAHSAACGALRKHYYGPCVRAPVLHPLSLARQAAVKALSWSPADASILATGGGTNDRCIRLWDVRQTISASSPAAPAERTGELFSETGGGAAALPQCQVVGCVDSGSQAGGERPATLGRAGAVCRVPSELLALSRCVTPCGRSTRLSC